jgi:sulfate adenylyltransferase
MTVQPHGGKLINRYADPSRAAELLDRCGRLKSWQLTERELSDLEMIASGALSPLTGFMSRIEFRSVLDTMRLSHGLPWTIPVTLAVSQPFGASLKQGEDIALLDEIHKPIAILTVSDVYEHKPLEFAHKVFKTTDMTHPGVAAVYAMETKLVGGDVVVLRKREHRMFAQYRFDPIQTRDLFENRKWRTVVGFQTRSPIHRAHEYIQKCALETVDGLFIHPIVATAKDDETSPEIRMRCYEALIENYFPKNRVALAVNPAMMRWAGPREAVFHAVIQKNYGCTHFIVGHEYAGIGNYHGPSEAQDIFRQYDSKELGIVPFFFDDVFYCRGCACMATIKTCPHTDVARLAHSGSFVREQLQKGRPLPLEFTRAEIGVILMEAFKKKEA